MEEDEFDYLKPISSSDKSVLKNLSQMGEKLKELNLRMLQLQAEADQAKKEYEHYANVIMPQEMFSVGIDSITLSSGGAIRVKHNFYCQPNKNPADKKIIADWLRANGGEHLIKCEASVSPDDIAVLESAGIPYIESTSVNTASLKAFLKDKIGATSGIQQINVEDIPKCIHFQEVTTVELEV